MTLKELKRANPDVILDAVTGEEIRRNANGAAMFYASLTGGTKPAEDRLILCAGQILTAGMQHDVSGDYLLFIRLTAHGNAKLDQVALKDLGSRAMLYHTAPISDSDARNLSPCSQW